MSTNSVAQNVGIYWLCSQISITITGNSCPITRVVLVVIMAEVFENEHFVVVDGDFLAIEWNVEDVVFWVNLANHSGSIVVSTSNVQFGSIRLLTTLKGAGGHGAVG